MTFLKQILVAIPLILGCFVAEATDWPDFPFVYAVGSAERDIPPNLANMSFEVKDFNENPELALAAVKQQSSNIVRLLKEAGIADNDIRAYEIGKNMVRQKDDEDNELKILGYEVSRRFEVKIRDLKGYPPLLNGLVTLKNIEGVDAVFDIDNRRAIEAELTIEAGADAKVRAESLARAMDCELGKPFAVSESEFFQLRSLLGLDIPNYRKSMHNGGDNIFVPAVISIKKSIYTVFQLGPPVAVPNKPLNLTR